MKRILIFLKKEIVLTISALLAVVSIFFVPPSKAYLDYIDFKTLSILFALMLVVAGFRKSGFFDLCINKLISKVKKTRALEFILVFACFFVSMLITNDVALIAFVPFAILLLNAVNAREHLIRVIVLQTIAANLGSMVTPIGNPQNLFLFTTFNMSIGDFFQTLFPYALATVFLLTLCLLFIKNKPIDSKNVESSENSALTFPLFKLIILALLFGIALLSVLRVLDYRIMLGIVVVAVAIIDFRLFAKADYILLLTFVAFFILVGNLKNIPQIHDFLSSVMNGNEFFVSLLSSQVISNVPAAVLLSGFTDNAKALLLGTDIGALGTIIASMASLISLRLYGSDKDAKKGKYFACFTIMNIIFLAFMLGLYFLLE